MHGFPKYGKIIYRLNFPNVAVNMQINEITSSIFGISDLNFELTEDE